ncbi:SDR family oxidoreductase, partial [Burkholderia sp. Ac-20379]|uniref:SDR family oxidoreductase n=1 Tax=Burkholderia sp. Ac-20379 TaxID=2703900 RepID=UPI001F11A1A6
MPDEARARLDRLAAVVTHRRADVTDADAVRALIGEIEATHGGLDGIVHAAGFARDKLLIRKSADELLAVLAPKVAGLAQLDAASAHCRLDFLMVFASVSGALGNPGQADYACANAFMDAFAGVRAQQVARGERHGRTLSIDWPYWRDGGMRLDDATLDAMQAQVGVQPLRTDAAMRALYAAYRLDVSQVLVLDGDHARLRRALGVPDAPGAPDASSDADGGPLRDAAAVSAAAAAPAVAKTPTPTRGALIAYLAEHVAAVLAMPADRMRADDPFDRYGVDSILSMQIVEGLEPHLGALPKTLLFEYPSLAQLADHLLTAYADALRAILPAASEPTPAPMSVSAPAPAPAPVPTAAPTPTPTAAPAAAAAAAATASIASTASMASIAAAPDAARMQEIAVIAVAGRYPGADTIDAFWSVLQEGRDCIGPIPAERWDHAPFYSALKGQPGTSYCQWGGFLSDVAGFDAAFFGVKPRDAALMDPQERLFLQTVWHLLERGGHSRERLRSDYQARVGVYVGAMTMPYHAIETDPEARALVGLSSYASIANRVSYFFDLQGPSVALDTMCSSGLQAVHLACQSLQRGECRLAIAGGVNLSLHPDKYVGLSRAGLLGSHAQSRSFSDGDGYLPAEGVGAVLLKPLADAVRDRDPVLAVIKASASNHGGHGAGYAAPSADAQARLIEDNLRAARIDARSIGYVEAAANGSSLGDAIELRALTRAFRTFTGESGFCAIGSVKSNLGHAEAASGMAQLTKVLLQLQHRMLVPSMLPLSQARRNPHADFTGTPFVPQMQAAPWLRRRVDGVEAPLRATVSAFGAGGSNVHLIVEEAPHEAAPAGAADDHRPGQALRFVFSAHDDAGLMRWLACMRHFIAAQPALPLARLADTLARRERLPRCFEIVADARDGHDL